MWYVVGEIGLVLPIPGEKRGEDNFYFESMAVALRRERYDVVSCAPLAQHRPQECDRNGPSINQHTVCVICAGVNPWC